jgi:hypothetical protein
MIGWAITGRWSMPVIPVTWDYWEEAGGSRLIGLDCMTQSQNKNFISSFLNQVFK